jgi:MFS transporter, SP family, sugar:H+ symporter
MNLSLLNSLPLVAYSIGVIIGAQVGERWGRKIVLISMNLVCITGILICITSQSYYQMLVGRMIINIHVGIEAWLVPIYQGEIVPAPIRGAFVSLYAFDHIFAGLISSIVTNFTSRIDNDACWMIPFGLMFIWPTLTLGLCWMVPESPRWLIRHGRFQEAVDNLDYLYGCDPNYDAEAEAKYFLEVMSETPVKGLWSDMLKGTNKVDCQLKTIPPDSCLS